MQSEPSGENNSKAPIGQQPHKKKKKSTKKPKPVPQSDTTQFVNEETVTSAIQTVTTTNKKKKKRNNKKKPPNAGEQTENLISKTFKASKDAESQSLNGSEENYPQTGDTKPEEQSKNTLRTIVKVGNEGNSSESLAQKNSTETAKSKKSKKKKNRNLNNSLSHSSTESPPEGVKSVDEMSATTSPALSKPNNHKNNKDMERTSNLKKTKSPEQKKPPQGPKQPAKVNNGEVNAKAGAVEVLESKQDISTIAMEAAQKDKSRAEILAAREAKKLAKQQAKKNATTPKTEDTHNVKDTENVNSNDIIKRTVNEVNMKDCSQDSAAFDVVDEKKTEKSREEILGEREAKKLAKQAAKNKNKTKQEIGEQIVGNQDDKGGEQAKTPSSTDETDFVKNKVVENFANTLENMKINAADGQKKKATTKAERRAIQEAQREAKSKLLTEKQQQTQKSTGPANQEVSKNEALQAKCSPVQTRKAEKSIAITSPSKPRPFKVKFFNQLEAKLEEQNLFVNNSQIHPAMVQLGEQYAKRIVVGSNARCIAFLNALKMVIQDYVTPAKKEFSRGLEASIKNCVDHLQKCRPLAVSVSNAYKYIKVVLTKLPANQTESELKKHLVELIDIYIKDQIEKAAQAISYNVQESISTGDVILTYGCSSLITYILEEAHRKQIDFRVIVVDSRPFSEGQELLRRLVAKGISCTCVLINAISFIMPDVTKVLLGAHALLANGYVVSRIGTAQVALVARSFNVSVFVCCEKHKFSERTQTDAIVYNELGNPNDLISKTKDCRLMDWKSFPSLYPLNLNYDVTPPELVNVVVTEVTLMPSTSAPVILRIRPNEMLS